MKLDTARFGEIEIDPKHVFDFRQGLPGFEQLRKFALLSPDPELPFSFLQSVEDGKVSFIVTNPFLFYKDYEFEISLEDQSQLKIRKPSDVEVWAIVTVRDKLETATMNLLAPVLLNARKRLGKQVVLVGTPYQTRHPLLPQSNQPPAKVEAGC